MRVHTRSGAQCPDGIRFLSRVEGAVWTEETSGDGDGTIRLRVSECPAGFALVRKQTNPQSDACIECPGTADHAYSLVPAVWNGNADEMNLDDFCLRCPTPPSSVKCSGGTNGNHCLLSLDLSAPLSLSSRLSLSSVHLSLCQ
jgi:hypothetical protein